MAHYWKHTVTAMAMLAAVCMFPALSASAEEEQTAAVTESTQAQTSGEWTQENGKFYYTLADGSKAVGEVTIDGVPYLFGYSGALKTDWQTVGGKRYYYDPTDGKAVFGWIEYFGSSYYVTAEDGKLTGTHSIDGELYSFDEDGVLYAMASPVTVEAPYFSAAPSLTEPETEAVEETEAVTEQETVPEETAAQEETAEEPAEPAISAGFHYLDGVTYYYTTSGEKMVGWLMLDNGWFFFEDDGAMHTGWLESNGVWFYFQDNGLMEQDVTIDIDGVEYTFGEDGSLLAPLPEEETQPEEEPAETITQSGPQVQLDVPLYKQKDAAWKNVNLGGSTIGSVGCLVTSLAMLHTYTTGETCTPIDMKAKLAFSGGGGLSSWNYVTDLGYTVETYSCGVTSDILSKIYELLKQGKPVVLGSKGSGQHYVIITGYTGDGVNFSASDFVINDPGYTRSLLSQQLAQYGSLYKLIYLA